jgi:hypothetical protein
MDSQLIAFVQSAYTKALSNGLTESFPVTLLYGNEVQAPRIVVVSFIEPVALILPLNVIWINVSPSSADYMKALRRVSKVDSISYDHTWEALTLFDQIMEVAQTYDSTDSLRTTDDQQLRYAKEKTDGLPNQLRKAGDTASGPLNARTLATGQQYGTNELIPRQFITQQINSQTNGFYGIILPMNTRLQAVEAASSSQNQRIAALESGAPIGLTPYVLQITAQNNALSFNVQHNKGTRNVNVVVLEFSTDGETTLYTPVTVNTVAAYHDNFVLVETNMLLPVGSRIVVYPAS